MFGHERFQAVRRLVAEYVKSPSLRHLREPSSVDRLAEQIVKVVDREPTVWRKWEGQREDVLRAAALCWIPSEDLRSFLNDLPGPTLTSTDLAQRLRAIHEEPYSPYPDEALQEECLALYARERAAGTELPAIIGALQEFVETETERLRLASVAAWRQRKKEELEALQQRFIAGADCKWVALGTSKDVFSRKNGRGYRLSPTKNKRWDLFRIQAAEDPGKLIGTYGSRGEANKALAKLAYDSEPRW